MTRIVGECTATSRAHGADEIVGETVERPVVRQELGHENSVGTTDGHGTEGTPASRVPARQDP